MLYSLTVSESSTFTVTHARHMAAKVATDLKRVQRFYGSPSDSRIADYEAEAIALMKAGYLNYVWYGFKRNGLWIEPTLKYTAQDLYSGSIDDDPGKIRPGADVSGASFYSYLTYSPKWHALSAAEQDAFEQGLPYIRTGAAEPSVNGYLSTDKTYSSGGRALERATVRSF
ncbi:hypothetical protein SAMN05444279_1385 [Ruegeria intermedia]|uniref:Bacterial HORMA domain-containing protein n=1 Tax=Ruegeria intermedia TaxID=996115 RepID=A0A1M5BEG7_9RHOB|nr:hypothetical protein [Ruegeria intermedia]SHF40889.1 hypothetical protein SAMN05444279_1385 [Ruegeria intermedia]